MNKELVEFLIKAKQATYAGKFAGEEALWIKGNPYWSMNYIVS